MAPLIHLPSVDTSLGFFIVPSGIVVTLFIGVGVFAVQDGLRRVRIAPGALGPAIAPDPAGGNATRRCTSLAATIGWPSSRTTHPSEASTRPASGYRVTLFASGTSSLYEDAPPVSYRILLGMWDPSDGMRLAPTEPLPSGDATTVEGMFVSPGG